MLCPGFELSAGESTGAWYILTLSPGVAGAVAVHLRSLQYWALGGTATAMDKCVVYQQVWDCSPCYLMSYKKCCQDYLSFFFNIH